MKKIFDILETGLERTAASLNVTLRSLSLGAQNSTTGIYSKGYANSTIQMVIAIKNVQRTMTALGEHTVIQAVGVTDTQVYEGDEITDANNNCFQIAKVLRRDIGDKNIVYECELNSTFPSTTDDRPYTYPEPPTETGGIGLNVGVAYFAAHTITSILADTDVSDWESSTHSITTTLTVTVT